MSIMHEDTGADVRRIVITGRLDMAGTQVLAPALGDLVATKKKGLIVDLTGVSMLASIGIRALIESAKVVQQRGGKLVLVVDPTSTVILSLQATGIDDLIPIYHTVAAAQKAVSA